MNKQLRKLIVIAWVGSSLIACKKELKDIGTPGSKVEGIQASWVLKKCVHVDEQSLTKEAANITRYFSNGPKLPHITFNDTLYTVDTVGLGINFFNSTSGSWRFDNDNFPSKIFFTPIDAAPFEFKLNGPIRPQDNLKFTKQVSNSCKGAETLIMSYNLEFLRK
jgi:hypothetical protein